MFSDRLTNTMSEKLFAGVEEPTKKVPIFSRMVGREKISSVRRGQHLNTILMGNKENPEFRSPAQSNCRMFRPSSTIDRYLQLQQQRQSDRFDIGLRSAKMAKIQSEFVTKR